jgi:hypothetical protein
VEERTLKTMMSSAFSNTDFEYSKTFDVRETFMKNSDDEEEEDEEAEGGGGGANRKRKREKLGNELDGLDIGPDFQV